MATRAISSGDEVTISYGPYLTNEELFSRYGFTTWPPPPLDSVKFACVLHEEAAEREGLGGGDGGGEERGFILGRGLDHIELERIAADLRGAEDKCNTDYAFALKSALNSVGRMQQGESMDVEFEADLAVTRTLLEQAQAQLEYAVDPSEDKAWLEECVYASDDEEDTDTSTTACVEYRSRRTQVWMALRDILGVYADELNARMPNTSS